MLEMLMWASVNREKRHAKRLRTLTGWGGEGAMRRGMSVAEEAIAASMTVSSGYNR
jgi:hypothetical protein